MANHVKVKKGLDIRIPGAPKQIVKDGGAVRHVALLGTDFKGLKPRVLVKEDQVVALGEPLFFAKNNPAIRFVSPGTGRIAAINRGRRRALQSIVIRLDEKAAVERIFDVDMTDHDAIRSVLQRAGLWTSLRERPYDRIANPCSTPRAIFVTAVDTRPLAADPIVVISRRTADFKLGLEVIRRLGDGPVYLCTGPTWPGSEFITDGIQRVEFSGPHPAGLVGTHIHYLNPVSAERLVWHIGYQDVTAIGHLFNTGRLLTERIVSLAGPGVLEPRLLRTRLGANTKELLHQELAPQGSWRTISGSVLDGHEAAGAFEYLGRYHNQLSAVSNQVERRPFGWLAPRFPGIADLFASVRRQEHLRSFTTARNGRRTALIPVGAFERVMPLDVLPAPLLKALLVKDTDAAQALGCLELAEEDLALCSFVCPAKLNYGAVLRVNLDQIAKEG